MVKQRFTALDVRASVEEMRRELTGLRLLNLYDLSGGSMFLFKFGHGEQKRTLLLENGVRLHLSEYVREKPKVPSQFTLKVRKHVRAWRLDTITQLQHDRTIDLCFGIAATEGCFHIIIELFGKGNIILTDHNYVILMLLRTHRQQQQVGHTDPRQPQGVKEGDAHKKKKQGKEEEEEGLHLCVRATYPITKSFEEDSAEQQRVKLTSAAVVDGKVEQTATSAGAAAAATSADANSGEDLEQVRQKRKEALWEDWKLTLARNGDDETIKTTLSGVHHFGPALAEHILEVTDVKNKKKKDFFGGAADVEAVSRALFEQMLPGMLEAWDIAYVPLPPGGYLVRKKTAAAATAAGEAAPVEGSRDVPAAVRYEDCIPVLLAQYKKPTIEATHYPSFGKACDLFFLYTETERIDQHNDKKSNKVLSKREKFERDHLRRVSALELEQEKNKAIGEAIIYNADKIDEVINLINGALAAGLQWDTLKALVRRRHAEGHPVAYMIHDLSLHKNTVSVLLEQQELYEDEDDQDVPSLVVEIDLSKTAHANASDYFTKKKTNQVKLEKTLAATGKAAAGAARKADRIAAKQVTKKKIRAERTKTWWEKFSWFRTSTGDLVLQGKDTQTTEILLRKVLQLGDVIVGCEVEGALPCVLRPLHRLWTGDEADAGAEAVSKQSLEEAGAWCVARSAAWESKQAVGSWWVHASQLAGGTASGCYLFEGEKRHLLPQPLTFSVGLLFCVQRDVRKAQTEVTPEADADSFEPADDAVALRELPTIEDLRKKQNQQMSRHHHKQQQQQPQPVQHRNARANKPEQQKVKEAKRKKHSGGGAHDADDSSDDDAETATTATTSTNDPHRQLTKHQKRKLKKIQDKYGDQDEEDRRRGALLNGNKLAHVQQEILAQGRGAGAAESNKNNGNNTNSSEHEEEEEEGEELEEEEVVTDFSDKDQEAEEEEEEKIKEENDDDDATALPNEKEGAEGEKAQDNEEETQDETNNRQEQPPQPPNHRHGNHSKQQEQNLALQYNKELREKFIHYTCRPVFASAKEDEDEAAAADVILHVLPVCAPTSTLIHNNYLFRSEIVFGNMKKGQVAQTILQNFEKQSENPKGTSNTHVGGKQKKDSHHRKNEDTNNNNSLSATAAAAASLKKGKAEGQAAAHESGEGTQPNRILAAIKELSETSELVEQLRGNTKTQNSQKR